MTEQVTSDGGDDWGDVFKNLFSQAAGVLIENERETVSGDNTSASPAVHNQPATATQPTGEVVTPRYSIIDWARENILTAAIIVVLLIVLIALLVKWA